MAQTLTYSEPIGTEQPTVKPSKQLRYYCNHRQERLAYQRDYYNRNKTIILTNKKNRYRQIKVQRTQKMISLIHKIKYEGYSAIKLNHKIYMDAYFHSHGRPKYRIYSKPPRRFYFHMPPQINILFVQNRLDLPHFTFMQFEEYGVKHMTGKQLSLKICHALGFEWGTSITWKEVNQYTNKIETHTICFDGSGLDQSHENDLVRLQACACETGLRGADLAHIFANKYSVNVYLQVWRGTQLISTSEAKNALKDYRKHCPLTVQEEFEQKIERELKQAWRYFEKDPIFRDRTFNLNNAYTKIMFLVQ